MAKIKISALPETGSLQSTDLLTAVANSTSSKITLKSLANSMTEVSHSISASYALTASYVLGGITSIAIQDDNISQGSATTLNFTGSGVTATVVTGTATINIPGSGTSGISGTSGTSGTSGNNGTSGTSGASFGTSGTSGAVGTSGTSGVSGTSGTSGANGTSGTSGANGTSGTSGVSGTSGTSGVSITINNNTDNYIITATGTANTVNGEANLTFNGNLLALTGSIQITGSTTNSFITSGSAVIRGSLGVGAVTGSSIVGRIDASNDVVAFSTSDIRYKTNIVPISEASIKINRISGVHFDWIEDIHVHGNSGRDVGVIAQELEAVLPEVVTTRDNGVKAVKYEKIVPLLIEAIKDLQRQINELKANK